jgi:hypothetical protein
MYSDKLSSYHEDGSGSAIIVKNMKVNSLDGSIVRSQFQNLNANTNILRSLDTTTVVEYGPTFLHNTSYAFVFYFKFKDDISIEYIKMNLINDQNQVLFINTAQLNNQSLSEFHVMGVSTPDEGNYKLQAEITSENIVNFTLTGNYLLIIDNTLNKSITLRRS